MTLAFRAAIFLLLLHTISAIAQPPTLDVSSTGVGATGAVKFTDPATIGKKLVPDITYDEVRGKYMWDNDWHPGFLILKGGHGFVVGKVKLNLYTQEVHYLDKEGSELVAVKGLVKGLKLYSGQDTAKLMASFRALKVPDAKNEQFLEQLNVGKVQLLKRTVSSLKKLPYDPAVGRTEYRFYSNTDYFILDNQALAPLHSLNKSSLSTAIKVDQPADDWLANNKNKLKSEEEVTSFLKYYNTR